MKKIMIIALSVLVSACACFECEDAERRSVTYKTTKELASEFRLRFLH